MLWLIVAIFSYLILAVVFLLDKYFLVGPIPNPKIYAFYIGILGILILFVVPFVDFDIPDFSQIILSIFTGILFIYTLFWFYKALRQFEVSRIVPAIGAFVPLFTFALVYIFSRGKETLSFVETIAFFLLIVGSVLVTLEKKKIINLKTIQISTITALMFSLYSVLSKYVYLKQPFWSGFIWIRIGGFLMALGFLFFSSEVKEEIFKRKKVFPKRTTLFLFNQAIGSGATILQNWAIALAPLIYVPIINALLGTQYAFLLILTILISLKFPQILKEEISRKIFFQKIIAILLIGIGLTLLAFSHS